MPPTSPRTVHDAYYGELQLLVSAEREVVEVSGEQVPTVRIRRSPEAELNKFVPIGTRKAGQLTMTIDDVEAELRPGRGKLTRASHRVDVTLAGTHYEFEPDDDDTSLLKRDGTTMASFLLDYAEGKFDVAWQVEPDESQPTDAAVGYALSVAFRTGALGIFTVLLNGSEQVPWTP